MCPARRCLSCGRGISVVPGEEPVVPALTAFPVERGEHRLGTPDGGRAPLDLARDQAGEPGLVTDLAAPWTGVTDWPESLTHWIWASGAMSTSVPAGTVYLAKNFKPQ